MLRPDQNILSLDDIRQTQWTHAHYIHTSDSEKLEIVLSMSLVYNFSILVPGEVSAPWAPALWWRGLCDLCDVFPVVATVPKCPRPQVCGSLSKVTGSNLVSIVNAVHITIKLR